MSNPPANIIAFLCNWCSYESADGAGRASLTYPDCLKVIRVMCTGRIDPQHIALAFASGADAVLVLGCRLGECHYKEGNIHAMKRLILTSEVLAQFGIDPARLRFEWLSATDHEKFVRIVREMAQDINVYDPRG